jgi:hypothetical protein
MGNCAQPQLRGFTVIMLTRPESSHPQRKIQADTEQHRDGEGKRLMSMSAQTRSKNLHVIVPKEQQAKKSLILKY